MFRLMLFFTRSQNFFDYAALLSAIFILVIFPVLTPLPKKVTENAPEMLSLQGKVRLLHVAVIKVTREMLERLKQVTKVFEKR